MSHAVDLALRFWDEMIARPAGPMKFRFVLQPVMASALAIRDGLKDARLERTPYFWTIVHDPTRRRKRLVGGIRAVSRVLILGVVMDVIYQYAVLGGFRPLQTVVIAVFLAFVPYMIVRGPVTRIERYILHRGHREDHRHG
ncbi:MAG TPA: hypothetical protein VMD53_01610 [Rhizomicrobium sp.]|nr:hypothetical protein [Rhizomicrobium sp.]